jgi:hypothetical protein
MYTWNFRTQVLSEAKNQCNESFGQLLFEWKPQAGSLEARLSNWPNELHSNRALHALLSLGEEGPLDG